MQIKNYGTQPIPNNTQQKNSAIKATGETVSFQSFLQGRMRSEGEREQAIIDDKEHEINELYEIDRLEAIAARSRIQRDTHKDVSDFLGIVKKNQYLMNGVDMDSQSISNAESASNQKLSEEQLRALSEKYDVDNLPPQEQYKLFMELTELGALTKDDVRKTQMSVTPDDDDAMGYLTQETGFRDVSAVAETNPKGRLEVMIHNERFTYDHVLKRYGQRCQTVAELADSHQKVLNTLNQI